MTVTDIPTEPGTEIPKVVYQLRRARALAERLAAASYPDTAMALKVAQDLPAEGWATLARHSGITAPSPDTTALAIEELRHRAQRRLSPAEHYTQAETCLTHAAAARYGSPEEDSYLRLAAIHATLSLADAGVPSAPAGHEPRSLLAGLAQPVVHPDLVDGVAGEVASDG